MFGPAIGDIITVHRGDDHMVQPQFLDRIGHAARFKDIQRLGRFAGGNVAKGTGAGANFAHDHHGGMALGPAFAHIRATCLFANGHQFMFTHNVAGGFIAFGGRGLDPDPIGFLGLRRIRAALFFRMTLGRNLQIAWGHVFAPVRYVLQLALRA